MNPNYSNTPTLLHSNRNQLKGIKLTLIILCFLVNRSNAQLNISPVTSSYPGGYNIKCHGATNGWIDILVEGGVEPYWFYWSNGSFDQSLDNLAAGDYTVVVYDSNNLIDSITVTLYEPNELTIQFEPRIYEGGYNISATGESNGKIESHISGGTQDYSYLWNTNSTQYMIEDIPAGSYSVTVTDMNSCSASSSITLTEPTPLHINNLTSPLHNGFNVSCKDGGDGAINISVGGGTLPYTYHWFNSSSYSVSVQNPTGIKAGHYSVVITDANDKSLGGQITLTEPSEFLVSSITPVVYPPQNKNLSCNNCSNGSLTANLTAGIGTKTYQWKDQATNQSIGQTTQTATGLSAGTYIVTVTDANGCTATGSHSILAPERDDWSMAGNAGINSSQFIGTTDTSNLIFKTNNSEQLRINQNGQVIFQGSLRLNNLSGTGKHLIYADSSGQLYRSIGPTGGNTTMCDVLAPASWYYVDPINSEDIILCRGNVGIGFHDFPTATLDISGNQKIGASYAANSNIQAPANGLLVQGTVGINTSSISIPSGFKLAVNGNIICQELKVQNSTLWDIVYGKDYSLMTLKNLRDYVHNYNHHPNFKSSNEMEKDEGFNVGDFNMRLLRTVEEQSLYIIQQDERLDQQEKRIAELERKISDKTKTE